MSRRKPLRVSLDNAPSEYQLEITSALSRNNQVHLELWQISCIFEASDASFFGGPHGREKIPETADVRCEKSRGVNDWRVSVVITVVDNNIFAWKIGTFLPWSSLEDPFHTRLCTTDRHGFCPPRMFGKFRNDDLGRCWIRVVFFHPGTTGCSILDHYPLEMEYFLWARIIVMRIQ